MSLRQIALRRLAERPFSKAKPDELFLYADVDGGLRIVNALGDETVLGDVADTGVPGHEYNYVAKTSDTSITGTSSGTAQTVVTATPTEFDGETVVLIEFSSAKVTTPDGQTLYVGVFDGSTLVGTVVELYGNPASAPVFTRLRLTPSAATKTYSIRAWVSSGTGTIKGSAGAPAYIRLTKAN
jgi:hypothetical protein